MGLETLVLGPIGIGYNDNKENQYKNTAKQNELKLVMNQNKSNEIVWRRQLQ